MSEEQSRSKAAAAKGAKRKKAALRRKKQDSGRFLIARLLTLVCLVLVVFEGRVVGTLLTHRVGSSATVLVDTSSTASTDQVQATEGAQQTASTGNAASSLGLAGAGSGSGIVQEETADTSGRISESIDSPAVVPEQANKVDDSYFSNAVFIGDSRMEGFRNSSGITQGTFMTSVGLSINDMEKQVIQTQQGNISVYQGLSGVQYDRIYLMLGANDLGYYPWEKFPEVFEGVIKQFHELQPHAIIYVCSVIYVDESKVAYGYDYDNNDNVRIINNYILQVCEDLWYSYYLNLNEVFTDGYGSLISDASSDGIHLYAQYLEQMLAYLKSHYIPDEEFAAATAAHPDDIANASAAQETEEDEDDEADRVDGEASAPEASVN